MEGKIKSIYEGSIDREAFALIYSTERERRGLSVNAFAKELGVPRSEMIRLENGLTSIEKAVEHLPKLGISLNLTLFQIDQPD